MADGTVLDRSVPAYTRSCLESGALAYRQGYFEDAIGQYDHAYTHVRDNVSGLDIGSYIAGQSARGKAAARAQIGTLVTLDEALGEARTAVGHHEPLAPRYPEARAALRNDYTVLGRILVQRTIRRRRQLGGGWSNDDLRDANSDFGLALETVGSNKPSVQTQINTLWIQGLGQVLSRDGRTAGRATARRALALGLASEKKGAPGSDPALNLIERLKAKTRAVVRPAGVLAVAALIGPEREPMPGLRSERLALRLAETLIVGPRRERQLSDSQEL